MFSEWRIAENIVLSLSPDLLLSADLSLIGPATNLQPQQTAGGERELMSSVKHTHTHTPSSTAIREF